MNNKEQFINYLLSLYGGFLDEEKKKLWLKDVFEVLEPEIDYFKFRLHFLHYFETKTIGNIPSPQWLYKESRQFLPPRTNKHIEELRNLKGVPCPPELKEKIETLLARIKAKEI